MIVQSSNFLPRICNWNKNKLIPVGCFKNINGTLGRNAVYGLKMTEIIGTANRCKAI
jgi:hypothetical protein